MLPGHVKPLDRCCHTSLPANESGCAVRTELETSNQCLQQTAMSGRCESATQQDGLSKESGKSLLTTASLRGRQQTLQTTSLVCLRPSFACHLRQRPDPKGQGCSCRRMTFQVLGVGDPGSCHKLPRPALHDLG